MVASNYVRDELESLPSALESCPDDVINNMIHNGLVCVDGQSHTASLANLAATCTAMRDLLQPL